jgi:putative ABC transport system permease protein
MSWIRIAWRNLLAKPLSTGLSTILLAFGVGLVSLLMLTERQLDQAFRRNIEDIDLVLGAKGSPLQLILANVYHIDAPTGNIRLSDARQVMTHPYIEKAIPLAYGDNFQRYRIVGTEPSYPAHYGMQLAEGRLWEAPFEATIGAQVARESGLKVGDTFFSAHGLVDETDVHGDLAFTVVGIFEEGQCVVDQLLLCNIESIWGVHEKPETEPVESSPIADEAETPTEAPTETSSDTPAPSPRAGAMRIGPGGVVMGTVGPQTGGKDPDGDREITAVLLKKRNPLAVLTIPNLLKETNMQVALPAIEVNRLTQNFGIGMGTLRAIAWLIIALSFASIFISVYDSLLARRYELALMRSMGASRGGIYRSLLWEGGLLSVMGAALGLILSRLGLWVMAQLVADAFHYNLAGMGLMWGEVYLACGAIFVGLIAAAIPGISAIRLDISRTLSDG